MFIVFDLDGTLALDKQREHHLLKTPKDWDAWHNECHLDEPHHPIVRLAKDLDVTGHRIEIWSGRSDQVIGLTYLWLADHGLSNFPLRMRKQGDHREDTIIKQEFLAEFGRPDLVFDDRQRVVNMWRSLGIVCCQVAPGDF